MLAMRHSNSNPNPFYLKVLLSLFLACCFELSALPFFMFEHLLFEKASILFRPQWVALVVLYWGIYKPQRFGVVSAWCVGLWLDCLHGNHLGQQAAAMAVLGYCVTLIYLRVRLFPLLYQSMVAMILIGIYLLVNRTLQGIVTDVTESWWYYTPIFSSALVWPVVVWGMHYINQK